MPSSVDIQYTRQVTKGMRALPVDVANRFVQAFGDIAAGRGHWDVVKMRVRKGSRLRIGRYRAIFLKDETALMVVVIKVAGRGDIY